MLSRHPGGVNVVLAHGSVHFIDEGIDSIRSRLKYVVEFRAAREYNQKWLVASGRRGSWWQ